MQPSGDAQLIEQQRKRSRPSAEGWGKDRQDRSLRWLAAKLPMPLKGLTIVDLGTRTGYMVQRLCEMGAVVQGLELVPETAEYARDTLKRNVRQGDMRSTPYRNDQWDIVLCVHALEHVPNPDVVVREIIRICRPGGWFMIAVPVEHKVSKRFCHNSAFATPGQLESLVRAHPVTNVTTDVALNKVRRDGSKAEEIVLLGQKL